MSRKVKSLKQTARVSIGTVRRVNSYNKCDEVQSFARDTGSQSFCYLFIALLITRCSKSAQKLFMCINQTTQLVLSPGI